MILDNDIDILLRPSMKSVGRIIAPAGCSTHGGIPMGAITMPPALAPSGSRKYSRNRGHHRYRSGERQVNVRVMFTYARDLLDELLPIRAAGGRKRVLTRYCSVAELA